MLLEQVKTALRLSNSAFDDEIMGLIDAAVADLRMGGVYFVDGHNDPLINRAIIVYAKSNFGYDNPDADRFFQSYLMLKQHLSLSSDFKEVIVS